MMRKILFLLLIAGCARAQITVGNSGQIIVGENGQAWYRGAWSSTTSYSIGNVVTYNSSWYQSTVNSNLNNVPSSSPSDWTAIPNPAAGAGGANAQVQVNASGALNGYSSFTFNSSTGVINANGLQAATDVFPHPPLNIAAYGAKCDGSTDDWTAIQNAVDAACNSPAHPPVYIPASANGCVFTKSLDITSSTTNHSACSSIELEGDRRSGGGTGSQLVAKFPSGQAYPALDFLGCRACGGHDFTLGIPSGSYATAGMLDGLNGNGGDGSDFRLSRVSISVAYPGPTGVAPLIIDFTDENALDDVNLTGSSPTVIGNGLGRSASVVSEYGPISSSGNSMTQFSCHNCTFGGEQGLPALQLTGNSDTYSFTGRTYAAITGTSANTGGIVEITRARANPTGITAENFRTENQSTATGVCAINDDSTQGGDGPWFGTFTLWSDASGRSLCSTASTNNLSNSILKMDGNINISWPGAFNNSLINISAYGAPLGSIFTLNSTTLKLASNSAATSYLPNISYFQNQSNICTFTGCLWDSLVTSGQIRSNATANQIQLSNGQPGQNIISATAPASGNVTFSIPNVNSNAIQPLSSATAGDCVQWIDSSGVQHLVACGSGSSLPSGVLGQTLVNTGAAGGTTYSASSPTMGVANGGAAITTAYTLLCDSATVGTGVQDRGKWAIVGASGSVTIPDLAGSGCSGFYGGILNSTGSSVTVSRQTSDTFNVYGPTQGAPSTGQTSFTVPAGGWASFEPSTSATAYDVRVSPPASGGGGSGTVTASPQYQVPVYSAAGTASTVTGDSNFTDNTSTGLLEYAGLLGFEQIASGAFSNTASNFYTQSLVNGCNPATQFYNVQFQYLSAALVGCITGPSTSPGSSFNQSAGVLGIAVGGAGANRPVGGSFYGFPEANSTLGYAINGVVQDVTGLTSGVLMAAQENDIQVENAPSAYAGGSAYSAQLYNPGSHAGQYPFNAFEMQAHNSATWKYGLNVALGALNNSGILFNVNANGTATSGANFNCPIIGNWYENYWNGSAGVSEGWQQQCLVPAGASPAYDYWLVSHPSGTSPGGQAHHWVYNWSGTQNVDLGWIQSDGSFALIQPSSFTGGNETFSLPNIGAGTSDTLVTLAATQTLTNKTVDGVTPTTMGYLDATSSIQTQLNGKVATSTTVNGHALSGNITLGFSDFSAGALANGTTATTQTSTDNTTDVATDAFVQSVAGSGTHKWSCQPGLGDGLNAIPAGTYPQTTCMNTTGSTVTITGLSCYVDGGTSSTMNASGHTLGALLTGAVTCSTSFAAGTQSSNVALTNGDYITFTFVADGTAKQTTWVVKGTY